MASLSMASLNLSNDVNSDEDKRTNSKSSTKPKRAKAKQQHKTNATSPITSTSVSKQITATSQQSRFHIDTFDPNSTEIDLKGVNITIGDREILSDAHLKLKSGVRYGMVGQNGVGKSVLMHVLANNILVGLPKNVRFLHIKQVEDEPMPGRTILQEVLEADSERAGVLKEVELLKPFIGSSSQPLQVSPPYPATLLSAIHQILISRHTHILAQLSHSASLRSRQRGHIARQELLAAEKALEELKARPGDVTDQVVREVVRDVSEKWESIRGGLDVEGEVQGDEDEGVQRAKSILRGLGFAEEDLGVGSEAEDGRRVGGHLERLSGGWRMRVHLAKALFVDPDVLLLDEPTNHLDLPGIIWLQSYLTSECQGKTIVVVSHDRNFLDDVTEETIIFRDKILKYHAGNYQDYEETTEEQMKRKMRMKELEDKRTKRIQESIQKSIQQARATGDDKRLGMVASRRKRLETHGGSMQKMEDGKKYKRSYHGYRADIVVESGIRTAPIQIPPPEPFTFPGGSLLQLSDVSFRYERHSPLVLNNISLDIAPHARIGFLGPNGCGKSTLMNLLAGVQNPTSGQVKNHHRLRIGYFSQHLIDQLDMELTPLQHLSHSFPAIQLESGISESEARAHFGSSVGLSGESVLRPIKTLSGGQRNRVALGLITFERPHVLVLDEITNHLDMGTVESLVEALCEFEGAVVVVSHDVWFLKQVVEGGEREDQDRDVEDEVGKGVLYVVTKKGELKRWEKGLDAYVDKVKKACRI